MEQPYLYAFGLMIAACLIACWVIEQVRHRNKLDRIPLRIHVNGIRGKSTVTRILAGMLRETGIETVAKTTGSAACLIDPSGDDIAITRRGAPTILEQVSIIRNLEPSVQALVIECMAIKPEYQQICEEKIVRSNIGVITNVREDHQEVLGFSLEEIAKSLLMTCPYDGVLITSECSENLLSLFYQVASERNSKVLIANPTDVSDEDVSAFDYIAFKENIAIGYALADHLRIGREAALRAMIAAAPDPGVLKIERKNFLQSELIWADLFAVNDRESVLACVEKVAQAAPNSAVKIGLLNNRPDREQRAIQFAEIAACELSFDYIALLGAYERRVEAILLSNGVSKDRIVRLGSQRNIEGEMLVHELVNRAQAKDILLVGLVNIHSTQADSLRDWFGSERSAE